MIFSENRVPLFRIMLQLQRRGVLHASPFRQFQFDPPVAAMRLLGRARIDRLKLAEAIQGLVQHMRAEQQMIRDWADAQAKLNNDIRRFMEILSREAVDR